MNNTKNYTGGKPVPYSLSICRMMGCMMIVGLLAASDLRSQQVRMMVGGAGGILGGGMSSPEAMIDAMEVHIEDLQLSVGLNDKQVGKLRLAARLVSKKVFDENDPMFLVPPKKDPKSTEDAETFSDEDSESQLGRGSIERKMEGLKRPVLVGAALGHETWRKAMDVVLTAEQTIKRKALQKERDRKVRKAAIQHRVWELAEKLRLRNDQIPPVRKIVDRIEGDRLVEKLRTGDGLNGLGLVIGGAQDAKQVSPADMEGVLTERQLKLFKEQQSKGGDRLGGLGGLLGLTSKKNQPNQEITKFGVQLESGPSGLSVKLVAEGTRAQKLGLIPGDVIDEVNDQPVDNEYQLGRALQKRSKVTARVHRGGNTITLAESNQ